jgi:ornithine carbamoyltransferase
VSGANERFFTHVFAAGVEASAASESPAAKRWLPDQAENRMHAQNGLLVWLDERS